MARRAEAPLGAAAQAVPHELSDSRLAQCGRTDRHGGGVGCDLRKQPRLRSLLARAGGARYEDLETLQPALEIGDEPERRLVTPVQVVD